MNADDTDLKYQERPKHCCLLIRLIRVHLRLIHFFSSSNTAAVIAFTPVRTVGSGTGAKSGE